MRHTFARCFPATSTTRIASDAAARPPVVRIANGTFYRRQPSLNPTEDEALTNRPLFPRLNFTFPADNVDQQYWAVVGPSNAGKTTFLEILRGQHLCFPPNARSYPYLSTDEVGAKDHGLRHPSRAIQYVGFSDKERGLSGFGSYMSARYESRREATDFSLLDYLKGDTALNAEKQQDVEQDFLGRIMGDLRLTDLAQMPVSNLSNGQTRRARIAKALLGRPELLLLDEPFMGLDPPTMSMLSPLLLTLAKASNPRLLLSLRIQDPIPDWITHVIFLGGNLQITHQGSKDYLRKLLRKKMEETKEELSKQRDTMAEMPQYYHEFGRSLEKENFVKATSERRREVKDSEGLLTSSPNSEPLIEMEGVTVKYGDKTVLGNWRQEISGHAAIRDGLFWTVRRGERWGVFGANGSGKTTLIAMITSDHPQAYSQPLKLFGRHRLPLKGIPGISVFELQSRIGHSSPEVHAFFPRSLSLRATLESAYADTPLVRPLHLTAEADRRIDACLRWFQGELNPALGAHHLLAQESLRRQRPARAEYVVRGNIEHFHEISRQFWFEHETKQMESVEWADNLLFGELPFSAQRLALFLRAIVKAPDLIVLDEAFSGMDDFVREKCILFMERGESSRLSPFHHSTYKYNPLGWNANTRGIKDMRDAAIPQGLTDRQALICISHIKEEVPRSVRNWMFLPEGGSGQGVRIGRLKSSFVREGIWEAVWGL